MKLKTFYLVGLVLSFLATLYLSFGQEPQVHLWNWFGYKFGLNLSLENIAFKALFVLFTVLYFNASRKSKVLTEVNA